MQADFEAVAALLRLAEYPEQHEQLLFQPECNDTGRNASSCEAAVCCVAVQKLRHGVLAAKLSEQQRRALSKNGKKPGKVIVPALVQHSILSYVKRLQTCCVVSMLHEQLIGPWHNI